MNKTIWIVVILLATTSASAQGQTHGPGYSASWWEKMPQGDSLAVIEMVPLYIFKDPSDMRDHQRMIYNLKKVYPIAKYAKAQLAQAEIDMLNMKSDKQRREYIRALEKKLKDEYTPILKQMTFSQGKILIKLIDRETDKTTYDIIKELRGGFSAFFWQSVARLFTANLKDTYDAQGEDELLEEIIIMYEAGML